MQTIYYSTPNFIHHQSNVVDFTEYRRKLALAEEGSLAPQPRAEECEFAPAQEEWEQPVLQVIIPRPRRSHSRRRTAWTLDLAASLGVVVMTLSFTLQVLLG